MVSKKAPLETIPALILASASPRRRQMMDWLGVEYQVVVSKFDESTVSSMLDPAAYVMQAAEGKAEEVASRRYDGVIVGVDTDVVSPTGQVLGKPADANDARRMLRQLSGRTHRVYSAICVVRAKSGIIESKSCRIVSTDVTFTHISDEAVAAYLRTGDYADKAGAYGIQGPAIAFVDRIDGDISSVIGMPMSALTQLLQIYGIPLWRSGLHGSKD